MYRLETRYIIIFLVFILWTVPIYMLIKYSSENTVLHESQKDLLSKLENLQSKLTLLNREISSKEPAKVPQGTIYGHNKRDTLAKIRRNMIENHPDRVVNLFVETAHLSGLDGKEKQFFKTFGSSGNLDYLYKYVKKLAEDKRKRILVTGGAGFVGSHLVDSLMLDGHEVIVCDNFFTGRKSNIDHWQGHPNFELLDHDVINPLTIEVDEIYHLASPASPVHYMSNPIKTIKTNTVGTINMLGLGRRVGAKVLIASTSEVYGDPEVHPQPETYWGYTNSVGPRSCYDESKRVSESLAIAYNTRENVSVRIARIFNTYGPRMHPNDGRVVSNFLIQAITNKPITVYGSGKQTRSFQYITDLVSGLKKLMESNVSSPVNLGNPTEMTIYSLALEIKQLATNSSSDIIFNKLPTDDPHRRKPDITKAKSLLNWAPTVPLLSGIKRTIDYFSQELSLN